MRYNQVIEVEYIDSLISSEERTGIASLLMLCEKLNQDKIFTPDFFFEVIKYGFSRLLCRRWGCIFKRRYGLLSD